MQGLPSLNQVRAEIRRREAERERERVRRDAEGIRERCRTLAGFIREGWHVLEPSQPYVHGWHIDVLCEHLEAVTDGDITRLLINIPPGTMKSLITSVFWPAWEWGPRGLPSMRYLTTSYSEKYVKRDSRRMRDLVQSEWFQSLWPEITLARAGEMSFANTKMGNREGVAFASLTGGRGDRVIIDDPHSTETAESPTERENTTRIFRESVPTRLNNPATSAIVVIMQRLHDKDVSGQILSLGLGYEHLMLPMEFEPDRRCHTSIGFTDPRSAEGDLLFPERFPRDVVERDKKIMGDYAVAGQLQQRPAPREGGLIKAGLIDVVEALPTGLHMVRGWDLAGTEAKMKRGDYTVGAKLGRSRDGVIYIVDIIRGRMGPEEVESTIGNTGKADRCAQSIPQDPGQAGKAQVLHLAKKLHGVPVTFSVESGEKAVRAAGFAAQVNAGNVKMLRAPWNDDLLAELRPFPGGQFDDQVDAVSRAFNALDDALAMFLAQSQ